MESVRITIDRRDVHYNNPNGLPIGITYAVDDPENPGKVAGSRSERSLTIVADKNTAPLYGEFADAAQQVAGAASRKPARVEVDGWPVFRGFAQLIESGTDGARYGRQSDTLRVALIGNNASWFVEFKAMKVADALAGYFPEEDFTDTWAADHVDAVPGADKYGLFLARVRDWATPGEVRYAEHTFFVFIADLLRDAFARTGYRMQSDFFESDEGKRYIHALPARPVPKDYGRQYEIYVEDNANTTPLPNPFLGDPPELILIAGTVTDDDPNDHYDSSTGFYTVPFSGHYTLTWGGDPFNFYTILDDSLGLVTGSDVPPGQPLITRTVFLTKGQKIGLYGAGPIGATANRCIFQIQAAFDFGENYTIDPAILTDPEWVMSDLLLGLVDTFCLQLNTDVDAGTVRVEPSDSYLSGGTRIQGFYQDVPRNDLTGSMDLLKRAAYKADSSRRLRYRLEWSADSADDNASALQANADLTLYAAGFAFPADRYQEGEDRKAVRYFCSTVMYRAEDLRHSSSPFTPILPLLQTAALFDDEGVPIVVPTAEATEPRILFYAGRRAGADGYVKLAGGSAYDPPVAWFVNYAANEENVPSLSFGDDRNDLGYQMPGLMQRFHLQRLARWSIGRTAEEYLFWRAVDIVNLDFRQKIVLNGTLWLLREVQNYVPGRAGSVKTLLEYDAGQTREDIINITSTPLRGIAATQ